MAVSDSENLKVECPICRGELVVDVASGRVLLHKEAPEPVAGGHSFDDLLAEVDSSKQRADEVFAREMNALEDRDRLMEEKFRAALEKAEQEPEDEPPVRPWDLD